MSAVLNAKHSDQRKAADALGNIHTALNRAKAYPQTDSFQITNIETIGAPPIWGGNKTGNGCMARAWRFDFF